MSKTILLVDDTETVLLFEKIMLKGSGFALRAAHNGNEAIEDIKRVKPDLILLDILMPEMDGIQTCRQIKGDPETSAIPIIMVTTKGDQELVDLAVQAGCNDYMTKPLDKVELLTKVRAFLG